MDIIYHDPEPNHELEREHGAVYCKTIEDLLAGADFVSLHVPLLETTRHLINEERLKLMKPTAFLVNTSRGPVIDEAALAKALQERVIAGAALDVFENEPEVNSELRGLPNAVLTPHIASGTVETRNKMSELAAANIIEALEGRTPPNIVGVH